MVNRLRFPQYLFQITHKIASRELSKESESRKYLTKLRCLASAQQQVICIVQYQMFRWKQARFWYCLLRLLSHLILIFLRIDNLIVRVLGRVVLIPLNF
jgi:hypothetical protein